MRRQVHRCKTHHPSKSTRDPHRCRKSNSKSRPHSINQHKAGTKPYPPQSQKNTPQPSTCSRLTRRRLRRRMNSNRSCHRHLSPWKSSCKPYHPYNRLLQIHHTYHRRPYPSNNRLRNHNPSQGSCRRNHKLLPQCHHRRTRRIRPRRSRRNRKHHPQCRHRRTHRIRPRRCHRNRKHLPQCHHRRTRRIRPTPHKNHRLGSRPDHSCKQSNPCSQRSLHRHTRRCRPHQRCTNHRKHPARPRRCRRNRRRLRQCHHHRTRHIRPPPHTNHRLL